MKIKKIIKSSLIASLLFTNLNIDGLALNKNINIENNLLESTSISPEDLAVGEWVTDIPINPISAGTIETVNYLNGKLYFIIGSDFNYNLNIYDIATGTWDSKPASITGKREAFLSAVVGDTIYYIGGYDDDTVDKNKVDAYNTKTDEWETKADFITGTKYSCVTVVGDKIYIIGGMYPRMTGTNTVSVYDTASNIWEYKESVGGTIRLDGLGLAVGKYIYYIGGVDFGYNPLSLVEAYNTETNTWETKANMNHAKAKVSGFTLDNKIYVYGGTETSATVGEYDTNVNQWVNKENKPNTNSYGFNTVIIDGLACNFTDNNTVDIFVAEKYMTEEDLVEEAVILAEVSKDIIDIENARDLVNQMEETALKEELQDRLNSIDISMTLDRKTATANLDIYIKSENMLLMSLSTNSITFEDYSGVDDLEKQNAIEISINSSLPYQLNSYLLSDIQNSDGSKKIDIDRLNIKDNTDTDYKEFTAIDTKLILKDSCNAGNDLSHNIDLKLDGGNAYPADIYKTVIKFEAEQK